MGTLFWHESCYENPDKLGETHPLFDGYEIVCSISDDYDDIWSDGARLGESLFYPSTTDDDPAPMLNEVLDELTTEHGRQLIEAADANRKTVLCAFNDFIKVRCVIWRYCEGRPQPYGFPLYGPYRIRFGNKFGRPGGKV